MKKDYLETLLNRQIEDEGLISPHRQYKFHQGRRWSLDFAWPGILRTEKFHSFTVEVDGGTWLKKGGHTTGAGFESDREKDIALLDHGWVVLRVTAKMVQNGEAIRHIKRMLLSPSHREVGTGDCHPVRMESVTTVTKNLTRGGAKPKGTRSAPKGGSKGSRRPTRRRRDQSRPRRKGSRPARTTRHRLPKEIEAYAKLSRAMGV